MMTLREARKNSGLRTTYIAKQLGVTRQMYYCYESKRCQPNANKLYIMADLFRVDILSLKDFFCS